MEDIIKETDGSLFFINGEREEEIKKRDRVRGEGFLRMLCHV